jgi:GTP-binding protein
MLPKVAVVGRPNVGKSTLFNRLTKSRASIIDSKPGVTRDRLYREVYWGKRTFELIDTGGLIPPGEEKITQEIKKHVSFSIKESDLILFLVDGEEGLHYWDEEICKLLRKTGKPIILVVNKFEGKKRDFTSSEFYKLGFDDTILISALHGLNVNTLMDKILEKIPEGERENKPKPPKLMILGHPNVGKSTIINKLLGSERVIVHDIPGTTRDIVEIPFSFEGEDFLLLDTSGIRRESKIKEGLEKVAVKKTKKAIEESDLVFFLLDLSTLGILREDLSIASFLEENAKMVIVLLNKCDLIEDKNREEYLASARKALAFLDFAPFIFTSGVTGENLDIALKTAKRIIPAYKEPLTRAQLAEALAEMKTPAKTRNKNLRPDAEPRTPQRNFFKDKQPFGYR